MGSRGSEAFRRLARMIIVALLAVQGNVALAGCGSLDFWVGSWVVLNEQGREVGTSLISKSPTPCAIFEQFEGADGSAGRSMTVYAPAEKRWHRLFGNSNGLVVRMTGRPGGGRVSFEGEALRSDGGTMKMRAQFEPLEGGVYQRVEVQSEKGWEILGEIRYVRR